MTAGVDFVHTMKAGVRQGCKTLVVYVAITGNARSIAGFAVSRTVGGAVTRNLVKRRLRARMRELLQGHPNGMQVVVRALPAAAEVSYEELSRDLDECFQRAVRKAFR